MNFLHKLLLTVFIKTIVQLIVFSPVDGLPSNCLICKDTADCRKYGDGICLTNMCFNSSNHTQCLNYPHVVGTACDSSSDCKDHARCMQGHCACYPGYRYHHDLKNCVQYRLGDSCLYSLDCKEALGKSAVCNDGRCTCKRTEHRVFNNSCYTPVSINEKCEFNEECLLRENHTVCGSQGFCMCQPGYQVYNLRCHPYSIEPIRPTTVLASWSLAEYVIVVSVVVIIILVVLISFLSRFYSPPPCSSVLTDVTEDHVTSSGHPALLTSPHPGGGTPPHCDLPPPYEEVAKSDHLVLTNLQNRSDGPAVATPTRQHLITSDQ